MIEMPNSQTTNSNQGDAKMEFDMLTTTLTAFVANANSTFDNKSDPYTVPELMVFGVIHQLTIIMYRFVIYSILNFHPSLSPVQFL
jgi:putative flippase GtrA